MELIVVTPPGYFEGEGALINAIFAAGLPLLHLRKPGNDLKQFRKLMNEIHPSNYPCIAIHQHHELAEEFMLKRLHFTGQARKEMLAGEGEELVKQGFVLSSSIHTLNDLAELANLDYVFFGPVFNSISKVGYQSALEADFVFPPHGIKVFAIGGVIADQLPALKRMNFDGAAVLGSVWQQDIPPLKAVKNLLSAINKIENENR